MASDWNRHPDSYVAKTEMAWGRTTSVLLLPVNWGSLVTGRFALLVELSSQGFFLWFPLLNNSHLFTLTS